MWGVADLGGRAGLLGLDSGLVEQFDGIRWTPIRSSSSSVITELDVGDTDVIALGSPFPAPIPLQWFGYIVEP